MNTNELYPISIAKMRERYLELFTGAVNDVMRFEYQLYTNSLPASFHPLKDDIKLVGLAFTVKGGPDIIVEGEHKQRAEMLEDLHDDAIVVWDCTGDRVTSQWGEVMTMAAKKANCRGAVVNGIRDTNAIIDQQFPVFHKYRSNAGMLGRFRIYHYQNPVKIGETIVHPGDWIFGDIDGILVVPQGIAFDVLKKAEQILNKEEDIKKWVSQDVPPTEVVKRGGYF